MYDISFSPSLAETVTIARSPVSPENQDTDVIFTARLNQEDYDQLVEDGGHVQLWSDIPHIAKIDGQGTWSEINFQESPSSSYSSKLRRIPLKSYADPSQTTQNYDQILLFAVVSLPSRVMMHQQQFYFTYRIAYRSGRVQWLGTFGNNGVLAVEPAHADVLYGLTLNSGWTVDLDGQTRTYLVTEAAGSSKVASLRSLTSFSVYMLGTEGLISDQKNASMIILVPLYDIPRFSYLNVPTCIFSASHDLKLSLSDEGIVDVSGSGTLLLQSYQTTLHIPSFVENLTRHSNLDNWRLLSSDEEAKTIILSSLTPDYIDAIVIPLLSSRHITPTIRIGFSELEDAYGFMEDIDLCLPSTKDHQVYGIKKSSQIDDPDHEDSAVLLELNTNNGHFIFRPIHKPRMTNSTAKHTENDQSFITQKYMSSPSITSSDIDIPSTSPHLRPSDYQASSSTSIDTLVASISSSPIIEGIDMTMHQDLVVSKSAASQSVTNWNDKETHLVRKNLSVDEKLPSKTTVSVFKAIFTSVKSFLSVFFRIFFCPIFPFGSSGGLRRPPRTITYAADENRKRVPPKIPNVTELDADDMSDGLASGESTNVVDSVE